jgi:hypothetical protein
MAQDISVFFKQIEKQSKQMAINAMREVAKKSRNMAIKTARDCLENYYASYKPKRYKRTKQLHKAILIYKLKEVKKGDNYSISFELKYDSTKLHGLYHSNSWYHQSGDAWKPVMHTWDPNYIKSGVRDESIGQDNGLPEPGWILTNYLQGVHPWGQSDSKSTYDTMTKFFEQDLPNKAGDMIYDAMQDAIVGFIKTHGGGK